MWKKINSPIVVCLIAVGGLLLIQTLSKPKLASEVRGLYQELMSIAEEGSNDAEKSLAIQKFATEISKQIKTGFSLGFKSNSDGKKDKDLEFIEVKDKVVVSGFKFVESSWGGRETFIFKLKNCPPQAKKF